MKGRIPFFIVVTSLRVIPMSLKARETIQHESLPGWLEENDPTGRDLPHRVHIFTRDETGLVYLPTQLERTLQLYW
jgi:hypothetical protein